MKAFAGALGVAAFFTSTVCSSPVDLVKRARPEVAAGKTIVAIGQKYFDEWDAFAKAMKQPAGISVYGDIFGGSLDADSLDILSKVGKDYDGYIELGMSWKDAMTQHGFTQYEGAKLCNAIATGTYDAQLTKLATQMRDYASAQFLFRPDYEVSGNLHANTNPTTFDQNTMDKDAYPKAFAHVRDHLTNNEGLNNVKFVYHPVRGEAEMLYPGDDVVDFQGFSVFNNDVCLPAGGTTNCAGSDIDPSVIKDLDFAKQHNKPTWIAESAVQNPAASNPQDFIDYLERITKLIEKYDFAGWTYINSDWNAHAWGEPWGDSRVERDQEVSEWWKSKVGAGGRYVFG